MTYTTDNRDAGTTMVQVEVQVYELVLNAIDNLPNGLAGMKKIVQAVDDYITDALDSEDEAILETTSPHDRIEDFLRYFISVNNIDIDALK